MTLRELRNIILKVVDASTSYDPSTYKGGMHGHCFAVAYVVQHYFGGNIVSGIVNDERHGWNQLPDGTFVDLTSCQFGGDGFSPLSNKFKVFASKTINKRFLVLLEKVEAEIRK